MNAYESRYENIMKTSKLQKNAWKQSTRDIILRIEVFAAIIGLSEQFLAWIYPLSDLVIEGLMNASDMTVPIIADRKITVKYVHILTGNYPEWVAIFLNFGAASLNTTSHEVFKSIRSARHGVNHGTNQLVADITSAKHQYWPCTTKRDNWRK